MAAGVALGDIVESNHMAASINIFFGRITALRGTRNLNVHPPTPRLLRAACLVQHPK